jgi:GABA(A) receptor-associated protein
MMASEMLYSLARIGNSTDDKRDEKPFKEGYTFLERKEEARKILLKYPERIPIICESIHPEALRIDKRKYLVPKELTVGQFVFTIRKRINLDANEALFIFTEDNTAPASHTPIIQIYNEKKDKDGFLYMKITKESTFGGL